MEIFQLRYFDAVVRRGSLTAAAVDCHVSQPSLSTQIKNLETELGVKLLERQSRGVVPTKAGRRLMITAQRLITEMDIFERDIRRHDFTGLPEIRIGIQPFLAATLLAPPLARYLGSSDSYQITVHEMPHPRQVEALNSRSIDLSLSAMPRQVHPQFESRELFELNYSIFCPSEHPLTQIKNPRLRDLLPHRLALFNDSANLVERVSQLGTDLGKPARIVFSSDHALTVLEMVAAGLGVAVLPTIMKKRLGRRKLTLIPLRERHLHLPILATWNRDRTLPPEIEGFISTFSQALPAKE